MTFQAEPLALALGALAAAGVILLLYLLRPEPQPVVVPSNLIWRRVLDERRRREDFWRWLISLLIALAIGLAILLAVGRPAPQAVVDAGGRTVLVLDNAPGMAAAGPSGVSRWDRALSHARRRLQSGNETSEFLLLDTAGQRGGRSFASAREALADLEAMAPVHGAEHRFPDLGDLLAAPESEGAAVVFIGDGVAVSQLPPGVERVSVLESVANAGITAFDVRPLPTDPGRFEAFVEAVHHPVGPEAGTAVAALQIDGAGGASLRRTLRLEPGVPNGSSIPLTGFVSGPIRAVLAVSGEDGFAADDVAHAYAPSRNRLRVALLGPGNPYLEAGLRLDPRVTLSRVDAVEAVDPAAVDLLVISGPAPAAIPPLPALFAGTGTADWLPPRLDAAPGVSAVALRAHAEDHPLLRGLALEDAAAPADAAFDAAAAEAWDVLLGDSRAGLLVARSRPQPTLAFAFPMALSNLPLLPDFPVLLSRSLNWLTDVEVRRAGLGPVRLGVASGAVFDDQGNEVEVRSLGASMSFAASKPSLYYVAGEGRELVVAASLLDRRVSDLNRSAWAEASPAGADGPPPGPARPLWPWLLLGALLLSVGEWVAFHRHATV